MSLFNCKLNRDISLSQPGDSGDSCNGQSLAEGVGGIAKVVVYNISDVPSLKFENDNRSDDTLVVDTINSTGQFYKIDFTSATYREDYDTDTHKWSHSLELQVPNIASLVEDILADGVNGKYLVCFLPKGSDDWRCFGWQGGASLDYSLDIAEDSFGYTVTLDDSSEYPLFAVDKSNFGSTTKVYTPIFKPLWETYFCEKNEQGKNTGYAVAMYVVKVNAAGQPLDKNNRLVQWSGLKQDAYKHRNISSDGGFNIIGVYESTAVFDGRPVREFDNEKCPSEFDGSLYIDNAKEKDVCLNSANKSATFTIRSTDAWSLVNQSDFVTITPTRGMSGDTVCTVFHNGVGGVNEIQFQNEYTKETVTLNIVANIISVQSSFTLPNRTHSMVITPTVYGCSEDYTYTISPSAGVSRDSNGYLYIQFSFVDDDNEHNYTLTLTHTCDGGCIESKEINIKILGNNTDPSWSILSSFCEISD